MTLPTSIIDVPFVYCEEYDSPSKAASLAAELDRLGMVGAAQNAELVKMIMVWLDSAYYEGAIAHLLKG